MAADLRRILSRLLLAAATLTIFIELATLIPYRTYARENGAAQCTVIRDVSEHPEAECCNGDRIDLVCSRGGWIAVFGRIGVGTAALLLIALVLMGLTARIRATLLILGGIVVAVAFSHTVKLAFLGEPVYPADFYPYTLRTFASVLGGLAWPVQLAFYVTVGLLCLPFALAMRSLRKSPGVVTRTARIVLLTAPLVLFWSLSLGKTPFWLYATQLKIAYLNATQNFFNLGPAGFWLHEVPKLQSASATGRYAGQNTAAAVAESMRARPDVFVILAESLWDPQLLSALGQADDPMPFFRAQMRKSGGYLQVPAFGGGTPKTEFEVLTGLSSLDIDGFPYVSALRQPTRSLATVFSRHGYRTVYAHPYKEWMFNRKNAIPRMGFEHAFFENQIRKAASVPPREDLYFDDASFLDFLCRLPSGDKPHFVAAATYGTHGPFPDRQITPLPLPSSLVRMAEKDQRALGKNFALIRRFDDALRSFHACLNKRTRPSLVIVYGDHWPNYSYLDFSLLWGDEPRSHFSQTGYFISGIHYAPTGQAKPLTSTNWLHLDILSAAGMPYDFVAHEMDAVREALPVLGIYKKSGAALVRDLPPTVTTNAALARYRELAASVLGGSLGL